MATRIYLRNGLGKPDLSDFGGTTGEILIDLQNYQIWTLAADGQSVEQLEQPTWQANENSMIGTFGVTQ